MFFARAFLLVPFIAVGCIAVDPMRLAPASAVGVWDAGAASPPAASGAPDGGLQAALGPGAPSLGLPEPERTYDLVALVDLAQRSNPETRVAWEQARGAAARLGLAEGAYSPALVLFASGGYSRSESRSSIGPVYTRGWAITPQLGLEWTLLDFGRRSASSDAATQAFAIHRNLAQALALQDQARFEAHAPLVRSTLLHLTSSLQDVFQEALDTGRLQWTPAVQALPLSVRACTAALAEALSRRLLGLAECFEKGILERTESLEGLWERVHAVGGEAAQGAGAPSADVATFLACSRRLVQAVARLEDFVRSYTGLLQKTDGALARPVTQAG